MSVLFLTHDLLFSSRVSGAARQAGVTVAVVGSLEQLREKLDASTVAILVDLENRATDPTTIVTLSQGSTPSPKTIAYGPHVKTELLDGARAAGFDVVLSRGEFDKQIRTLLQTLGKI